MNVPLLDLRAQNQPLRQDILRAIDDVIASQNFILGPQVAQLEKAFATLVGASHAVACASGSDALLLSLMASGLQADDAVITSPFTFFATAAAISRLGAKTLFIDIDPKTYTLDPEKLRYFLETSCERRAGSTYHTASGRKIHAIIPIHLFGQCAAMDAILALSKEWDLVVIEDAAQAIGAGYKKRAAGSMGDFGCFSFFPSKNLGAMGDGGMVVTSNATHAERLRILRVHGGNPKYYHKVIGINSRLDTLQAAILLVKWPYLSQWTEGRRRNAAFYDSHLTFPAAQLALPHIGRDQLMVYNQYCIRTPWRDELRLFLQEHQIGTEIYYPLPLHLQDCFSTLGYHAGDFPESEKAAKEILALPIYCELTSEQLQYVVSHVTSFIESKSHLTHG